MERVTISLPKQDVRALIKLVEELQFLEKVDKGKKQIEEGKFVTYEEFKKKHNLNQ